MKCSSPSRDGAWTGSIMSAYPMPMPMSRRGLKGKGAMSSRHRRPRPFGERGWYSQSMHRTTRVARWINPKGGRM